MDTPILTVSQLTQAIKLQLESTFPLIWLQGEISNFKKQTSGHLYFSLKDANAQVAAVMFKGDADKMKNLPKDGAQAILKGEINVYPPSGKYQIVVRELRPVGLGELLLKLEELKAKLHEKGYFKHARKKPLPKIPKVIGIVTSPTGAVIQDVIHVLSRRFSGFHLILNPVKVQGDGAAQEIAQAIRFFNEHQLVDVMIVGRGGGSLEDLWAFNEEVVATAIYESQIPIISAVGHETDHCIADYVADVRAPTPSAAAEIVIAEKQHLVDQFDDIRRQLDQTLKHRIIQNKHQLAGFLRLPIFTTPYAFLGQSMQKIDHLRDDLDRLMGQRMVSFRLKLEAFQRQAGALKPDTKLLHYKTKLEQIKKSLDSAWNTKQNERVKLLAAENKRKQLNKIWERLIYQKRETLERLIQSLHSIDPKNLLKKGYAILFAEKSESVITSIQDIACNESVRVLLGDGELLTEVKEKRTRDK